MTGLANQAPESENFEDQLEEFEELWNTGTPPDIRNFLKASSDLEFVTELILLDLEYRWKRFPGLKEKNSEKQTGLPMFPTLRDYAMLEEIKGKEIFTPMMIGEEYRVRKRWGDQPDRTEFLSRLSNQHTEIEAVLAKVDSELKAEGHRQKTHSTQDYSNAESESGAEKKQPTSVPRKLGRYELVGKEPVGRGGFGEVWKAYDENLNRYVAIKIPLPGKKFPPRVLQEFMEEGKKVAELDEINGIIRVYDADTFSGHTCIVSQLIDGESLEKRIERLPQDPLSYQEAARIVAQVARALHTVYSKKGIVHRDLKPGNILLDQEGKPFIGDFGLAATEEDKQRQGRGIVGTYAYMPPEQASGDSHYVDTRGDIYSLGVVLFELLTGRRPFEYKDRKDLVDAIIQRPPPSIRGINDTVPKELETIVGKCLEKKPAHRYSCAGDLAEALEEFIDHLEDEKKTSILLETDIINPTQPNQRKDGIFQWLTWVLGLILLITVLVATYFFIPPYRDPSPKPEPEQDPIPEGWYPLWKDFEVLSTPPGGFVHSKKQSIWVVQQEGNTFVKIGEIFAPSYKLKMKIEAHKPNPIVAVILGLQNIKGSKNYNQFQTIRFSKEDRKLTIARRWTSIYSFNSGEFPTSGLLREITLDNSLNLEGNLLISVVENQLKEILWNEKPLEKLTMLKSTKSLTGGYGFFVSGGTARFYRPLLHVDKKKS